MPAPKPQTISNIATELGEDSARIRKLVQALGIRPTGKNAHNADLYRMSKAQKAKLRAASREAAQGGSQQELDLKDQKTKEEIEHLRLKNRKLRDESTPNRVVAEILGGLCTFLASYLTQKLEIENPVHTAGLEPAEIRGINKKLNDEIRARFTGELEKWKQYVDDQQEVSE
jgi:hypothetical protein